MKTLHILGIGGTFMSALALLARESGYHVTGCDQQCYSPVRELLADKAIVWEEGYEQVETALKADLVIVGNAIKRGMPVLEAVLNARKPIISGPQWLAENILPRYKVIAVSGTHGKTSTTAMITHILQHCGLEPGFLIGGVAPSMQTNAHLGKGEWFVIEADEYDSAFFDKRPKLMHYRPHVAILNNLEFDHADIYPDLEAIQQQFHYFIRTIAENGLVLYNRDDVAINAVLKQGVYSQSEALALDSKADWGAVLTHPDGSAFELWHAGERRAEIQWPLLGDFNVANGLAALAASAQTGLSLQDAAAALSEFTPVKRRLEKKGEVNGVTVYDDFAHHPTAIRKTITALRQSARHKRIIAILEMASFTMRQGVHQKQMGEALQQADSVVILQPEAFSLQTLKEQRPESVFIEADTSAMLSRLQSLLQAGDAALIMSNRGFDGLHQRLLHQLETKG